MMDVNIHIQNLLIPTAHISVEIQNPRKKHDIASNQQNLSFFPVRTSMINIINSVNPTSEVWGGWCMQILPLPLWGREVVSDSP
uniref:Putative ovule protein n=1 Tax=Solanum chacoense TaxID=4108 RepID=A0A0V0I0N2_SOLCH